MKRTTGLAIIFWAVVTILGLVDPILPVEIVDSGGYQLATAVIVMVPLFAWFLEDARELQFKPSTALKVAVVALAPVAVSYYGFKHTGLRRGLTFVAKAIGLFLLVFGFLLLASVVVGEGVGV